MESQQRYAYLGPEGTFTEAALAAFDPAALAGALPCATIEATLDAVRGGEVDRAIVPIENSVEGAVNATLDELATGPDIVICAELLLPVTFALLARPGTAPGDVKTVGGHPQAQAQCRRWLAEHLPDAEWMPASSNAEAARQAAEGIIDAALAGAFAADRYGLAVLASEVSDVADAVTRFVVVGRPGPVPAATGADRTSLVAFLREDHPGAEPLSCPTIQATLAAVRDGAAERAVVPIESSVEGVVTATLDDLAAGNDLVIVAELQIPVAFALLARTGTTLGDIKRVSGHPQAMPQCRAWLAAHLPDAEWIPVASNAEAARQAADGQVDAALAGAFAAGRYGLAVIAPDVHDRANAVTRFVVVSAHGPLPARTGTDRTSVAAFLAEDHPGALLEILTEFAVRGINLTTIQSRPTGDRLGQYYFFIDCEGHVDDARVGEALMGLRRVCAEVHFLGSYARCDGGTTHVRRGTSDAEFASAAAWLGRLRFGRP